MGRLVDPVVDRFLHARDVDAVIALDPGQRTELAQEIWRAAERAGGDVQTSGAALEAADVPSGANGCSAAITASPTSRPRASLASIARALPVPALVRLLLWTKSDSPENRFAAKKPGDLGVDGRRSRDTSARDTGRAMSQENLEIVREQFEATDRREFARPMADWADDIEVVETREGDIRSGTYAGREVVGEFFGAWFQRVPRCPLRAAGDQRQ
jgi:hypothetical protein